MKAILDMLPAETFVIRESQTIKIQSSDLVVGDVVKITIGSKVPADLCLLTTSGDVRFDRSMLTGESEEIDGSLVMTDTNFLESRNVALMGTMVTNGSGTGVVVQTGKNSVMGHIAVSATTVKDQPTLIQQEITRFVIIIVCLTVVLALALLFTWVAWLRVDHSDFINVTAMLDDVMGSVVAFIPEGLPVAVALTMLMIARRMKDKNILPKGLTTVETLGCVNVICSDKTGTLTENRMTVVTVAFVDQQMSTEEAYTALADGSSIPLVQLHEAAALCNDADFDPQSINEPVDKRSIQGNATDGAALKFAESAKAHSVKALNDSNPRVFTVPFNSKNKWMVTLHKTLEKASPKASQRLIVKGAADILLPDCSRYWSYECNAVQELDATALRKIAQLQDKMSLNAERVILLCERSITPFEAFGTNAFKDEIQKNGVSDLTLIGMLGIIDPPRKETAATVAACRRAGSRFLMVTGDLGLTGAAVARNVGIFTGDADPDTFETIVQRRADNEAEYQHPDADDVRIYRKSLLLEGPSISHLTDEDWDLVCSYEEIVFGRTLPEQKLRIVNEFKARDYVVAVTGDGVNDAPALRAADVGVAVVSGSDVALEAADLVLLDKFDSIVDAIRLGRLVFQNLQKVTSYLLPAGSWSEVWPIVLNVFFGVPLPLSSFLMIIICVFTDLVCSLTLIMEQEEFDLLELAPRNHKKDHLITLKIYIQSYLFMGVMETVSAHAMFFFYYWKYAKIPASSLFLAFGKYSDGFYGYTAAELNEFNVKGQCAYFVCLVIMQMGNLLSVRNKRLSILQADPIRKPRRNPYLVVGMFTSLAIAIFVTMEPGIQKTFGTASVPIEFWLIPVPLAFGVLCMDEIRKLAVRTWPNGPLAKIAW
jgi:sodium/potassium-transporting ATPase subunit alpha